MSRSEWMPQAACRGMNPEVFFPATDQRVRAAVAVCRLCPVQAPCLAYALADPELVGIWAETTSEEREVMRLLPAGRRTVA